MPDTIDQGAESTVSVLSEDGFEMPSEDQLQDAQAAAMLSKLFFTYKGLKKSRPKFPAEAKVLPAIINDPDSIDLMVGEAVQKFGVWVTECSALLLSIRDVGDNNPGANIHITGKDGRVFQTNGTKLFEALLRTEAQILSGHIAPTAPAVAELV